ncbi:MAG TPA: hypothetical protein VF681_03545 [Abditibacteriaceae bacterium]|jgi:hypothetical protein
MIAVPGLMVILLGFVHWVFFQQAARHPVPADYVYANLWPILAINFMCLGLTFAAVWAVAPQFFVQFSEEGTHWLGLLGYKLTKWSDVKSVRSTHYSGNPIITVKLRFREIRMLHLVFESPQSVIAFIEDKTSTQV